MNKINDYLEAAVNGDRKAMLGLGNLYLKGAPGLDIDGKLAEEWLLRSAAAGEARAMYDLSTLYKTGAPGIMPDIKQSEEWYRKAMDIFGPWG
jgi:TPR repeat protein